jgi:lipid-A-disaccharide synthase
MPDAVSKPIKIMMVAGEHSGDILAAGLIRRLKEYYPNAQFLGIGGQRMIAEGFESLYPMSKLSVFGLFEVLKHLPELLKIRANLRKEILHIQPDVFVGIDAPDFNLKLERDLYQQGIKTVHYVSPTVWAWRPKRIKKLIGSLNALLCIFPFEETYFEHTPVPAYYIGHPLADEYKNKYAEFVGKPNFGIAQTTVVLTLMPGSRVGELNRHSLIFLEAAKRFSGVVSDLKVLVPMPDKTASTLFKQIYNESGIKLNLEVNEMTSSSMIAASDFVLVASGTATLEVMLLGKPMVVGYRPSPLTSWVFKTFNLLKTPFVSMPNIIASKTLVKEFLHENMTADNLADELIRLYKAPDVTKNMVEKFSEMKEILTRDADAQAALIVSRVIKGEIV